MIRYITGIIILATTVLWVCWDVYAYIYAENATFSVVITDFSLYSPIFPLGVGILIGHFFYPARGSN